MTDFGMKLPNAQVLEKRIFALRTDIARFWYHREAIDNKQVKKHYYDTCHN